MQTTKGAPLVSSFGKELIDYRNYLSHSGTPKSRAVEFSKIMDPVETRGREQMQYEH